jgi:hypothetical protein
MASLPRQDSYTTIRNLKWSPAEKTIARRAFNLALQRELAAVIREVKQMAARIEQPSDLWELERYLTHCRKEIDRQYDYRYSILLFIFADLIKKDRLREQELDGLAEDKLGYIRWNKPGD